MSNFDKPFNDWLNPLDNIAFDEFNFSFSKNNSSNSPTDDFISNENLKLLSKEFLELNVDSLMKSSKTKHKTSSSLPDPELSSLLSQIDKHHINDSLMIPPQTDSPFDPFNTPNLHANSSNNNSFESSVSANEYSYQQDQSANYANDEEIISIINNLDQLPDFNSSISSIDGSAESSTNSVVMGNSYPTTKNTHLVANQSLVDTQKQQNISHTNNTLSSIANSQNSKIEESISSDSDSDIEIVEFEEFNNSLLNQKLQKFQKQQQKFMCQQKPQNQEDTSLFIPKIRTTPTQQKTQQIEPNKSHIHHAKALSSPIELEVDTTSSKSSNSSSTTTPSTPEKIHTSPIRRSIHNANSPLSSRSPSPLKRRQAILLPKRPAGAGRLGISGRKLRDTPSGSSVSSIGSSISASSTDSFSSNNSDLFSVHEEDKENGGSNNKPSMQSPLQSPGRRITRSFAISNTRNQISPKESEPATQVEQPLVLPKIRKQQNNKPPLLHPKSTDTKNEILVKKIRPKSPIIDKDEQPEEDQEENFYGAGNLENFPQISEFLLNNDKKRCDGIESPLSSLESLTARRKALREVVEEAEEKEDTYADHDEEVEVEERMPKCGNNVSPLATRTRLRISAMKAVEEQQPKKLVLPSDARRLRQSTAAKKEEEPPQKTKSLPGNKKLPVPTSSSPPPQFYNDDTEPKQKKEEEKQEAQPGAARRSRRLQEKDKDTRPRSPGRVCTPSHDKLIPLKPSLKYNAEYEERKKQAVERDPNEYYYLYDDLTNKCIKISKKRPEPPRSNAKGRRGSKRVKEEREDSPFYENIIKNEDDTDNKQDNNTFEQQQTSNVTISNPTTPHSSPKKSSSSSSSAITPTTTTRLGFYSKTDLQNYLTGDAPKLVEEDKESSKPSTPARFRKTRARKVEKVKRITWADNLEW